MDEYTCSEACAAAPESALGVLDDDVRAQFTAHLIRCQECRAEVKSFSVVASRLLDLIPGTEPPLGFDRRVLARVGGRRRPWARIGVAAVAAAAAAAIGLVVGLTGGSGSGHPAGQPASLTAALRHDGRAVGEVAVYARTGWVHMVVSGSPDSGMVSCELIGSSGTVKDQGWFELVHGSGSWGAPDSSGLSGVTGARVIDARGAVIASATFSQ